MGFITLRDAETGEMVEVDTQLPEVRSMFEDRAAARLSELADRLKKTGVDQLAIQTGEDYAKCLRRFFHMRESRFH